MEIILSLMKYKKEKSHQNFIELTYTYNSSRLRTSKQVNNDLNKYIYE